MTVARSQLVDLDVTSCYHCTSRCVRRAHLCGEGYEHRKQWIEDRLEELAGIFAISVFSYSVLDNHLHVVVQIDGPDLVATWSDHEVAQRWGKLYPPRDKKRKPLPVTKEWIKQKLKDPKWLARTRKRLALLGWFMKCLKEPLARRANAEDDVTGHFWESRYQSIAILDEESLFGAYLTAEVDSIFTRLGTTAETWKQTLGKLFSRKRLLGVAFAFSRARLNEAAAHRGCHHLANLNGCQA
jgi:hypothetical protein